MSSKRKAPKSPLTFFDLARRAEARISRAVERGLPATVGKPARAKKRTK